jgi:mannitol-1-phosphate 5-dehydrogenase
MALNGKRTFVGFGFGPIQAGLFLHEAYHSNGFGRMIVAEVMEETVRTVRQAGGRISINVACFDRVEPVLMGPVEMEDPACPADRIRLVEAIAAAEEIATALPSVRHYVSESAGSVHRLLAEGLRLKAKRCGPRSIVYAAENHNHAAEILEEKVLEEIPSEEHEAVRRQVRFLNTVIGKMSGIIYYPAEIEGRELIPIVKTLNRAFLVEKFNRIFISAIHFDSPGTQPAFRRGIEVFEEKEDLLPFEEAKLYGHNATHALAAYVGAVRGVRRIADFRDFPDIMRFLRAAFIEESGAALIRRHAGVDFLFTEDGYRDYADDLLARMVNPYLQDSVERVGRDAERKLGWDDRLAGTVRLAMRQGVTPRRFAFGIAAAIAEKEGPAHLALEPIWKGANPDPFEQKAVLRLVEDARLHVREWVAAGFPDLEPE